MKTNHSGGNAFFQVNTLAKILTCARFVCGLHRTIKRAAKSQ
jgi:hypothetical protein